MSSTEGSSGSQYRSFEVTLDVTRPNELAALQGLARACRWSFRETTATEAEEAAGTPVPEKEFTDASAELFGNEVYGRGIASWLEVVRECYRGTVRQEAWGYSWYFKQYSGLYNPAVRRTDDNPPPTSIERYVRESLEKTRPPFPIITSPEGEGQQTIEGSDRNEASTAVNFEAGPITVEGLRDFVLARNYRAHRLSGSLGKGLHVLAHMAGTALGRMDIDTPHSFMDYDELKRCLRSQLSLTSADLALSKVEHVIGMQLKTGRPTEYGEVIIDGGFEVFTFGHDIQVAYERIAGKSLEAVAGHYCRQTVATRLLTSLASQH